ncbi:uncharacterized protein LOC110849172 [Folsomia candida]|uniref:uncharacterized protein LOC110849172 n=1 Tax=Folsomia candida TaxID=158441 RepID=UPI001605354E|nr:uncharacterized protein LOC110849172 [Folsomia candida]XP_035707019.1 uncharacterized protein LOC110849172 [Folsomia candida]XP_035707020.1 uncharacterized protein LOC110849172 [Folsomia candida]
MRIDDSHDHPSSLSLQVEMTLEQSVHQKLSLMEKELSSSSSDHNSQSRGLSPGPGQTLTTLTASPTTPSGDESSSASGSAKKISFGKVFSKNEQPQSITSPSPTSANANASSSFQQNSSASQNSYSCTANHGNHNHNSKGGSSNPGTPTSPNLGKSRHSSTSSTGSDKDKSVRVTRKVFNTWRNVCGKKTKDLFKRWKTLPEHQTENDDDCHPGSTTSTPGRTTPTTPGFSGGGDPPPTTTVGKIRMLVKKHSQVEMPEPVVVDEKSSWSVHVWATYVQRGSVDEEGESEEKQPGRDFLSDFQKVKLTHFFRHVLDMNKDDVISASDFVALNQRIRHYIEWSSECIEFHILKEVHSGFLECFLNQPLDECSVMYYCHSDKETRDHVNIEEWLDVWGELLHGKRVMETLPLWLQYFPKVLFQVINKNGSGIISKEQLRAFYTMFLGIDFRVVNETLDSIYDAMTDKGSGKIDYTLFKLCFSNFLFGKYPHGPGQYVFGICSQDSLTCPFPIDYSALNTSPDDLEPYNPVNDKDTSNRRSVIV